MITIIGGVYQGKLDYVIERFGVAEEDVYRCEGAGIAMPKGRVCYEVDKWILALVQDGQERGDIDGAVEGFIASNPEAIVICNDIFCGVVPIDPALRAWREAVGRAMVIINKQAEEVVRVFCGIPTRLK